MNAGRLNRRITLETRTVGKDAYGGNTEAWAAFKTVWAAIKPLSGTERQLTKAGGEVAEAQTEITIRYTAGVTEQMRVAYGGKHFNIRHVKNADEANVWLILTCDSGTNNG